ncbi:hypothetical protein JIN84_20295 [Luteolibacter yonseiensis]|uniref:DUF2066 domain-containing protein n=1 Tax=Luteolibacter yonseiensis TaxID=1144680 RepID=A0A934VDW2_9BACT|nr:hypothetical protein [Luteolibacter yonseiensis]MBK1817974.1 hypothetical protein [Luteolibacter yonseiensis]
MKLPVLSLFFAFLTPLTAGQWQPSQISSGAKWMVHADIDAMRESRTGQAVFSLIEANHEERFPSLTAFFTLQPLDEIHGITLYGDGTPENSAALIDGKFDRQGLESLLRFADTAAQLTHAGTVVHSWLDDGVRQYAAFANENLLVFSRQEEGLKRALDTLKTPPPAAEDSFTANESGKPLLVARARISEIGLPSDLAKLVRMAKTLQLAALESDGRFVLRASAETESNSDADRLRRMIDGIIAFAQIPDAKLEGLDLRAELDSVTRAPVFTAALSLPVDEWIPLMEKAVEEGKKLESR